MQSSQTLDSTSAPSNATELVREYREHADRLLRNIKQQLPKPEEFLARVEGHWGMEDLFYRFYHQSFKVYHVQHVTEEICKALQDLLPDHAMNKWFSEIVAQGTGQLVEMSHNQHWLNRTRPIIEAFSHAHYFLKMAVKYGKELESAPDRMPSGWAAVLYLYDLR